MQQLVRGRINPDTGRHEDPVSMIISDLTRCFALRAEEDQRRIDLDLETCRRRNGETFEAMQQRYQFLMQRQRAEGLQQYSWRHYVVVILRNCDLPKHQMDDFLLQRDMRIPDTEVEFRNIITDH